MVPRNDADDSSEGLEGSADDHDLKCDAEHDENQEDDNDVDSNDGDDNKDDLRARQIRIEDEPTWIKLVDGDRLYCSKIDPDLSVLFELVPAGLATTVVASLAADEQQPDRTPADWRLKLPARGSLRLQRNTKGANGRRTSDQSAHRYPPATRGDWQQPVDLGRAEAADWRLKLPARGSLRLQ